MVLDKATSALVQVFAIALLAFGLAGCRNDVGERPLGFEPGTYQGKKDAALSKSDVKALQERARLQN